MSTPGKGSDNGREGFSERYAREEPVPCERCGLRGWFHWPSLADHAPITPPREVRDSVDLDMWVTNQFRAAVESALLDIAAVRLLAAHPWTWAPLTESATPTLHTPPTQSATPTLHNLCTTTCG